MFNTRMSSEWTGAGSVASPKRIDGTALFGARLRHDQGGALGAVAPRRQHGAPTA